MTVTLGLSLPSAHLLPLRTLAPGSRTESRGSKTISSLSFLTCLDEKCISLWNPSNNEGLSKRGWWILAPNETSVPDLWVATFQPLPGAILLGVHVLGYQPQWIVVLHQTGTTSWAEPTYLHSTFPGLVDVSAFSLQFFVWSVAVLRAHPWW